jgi:hypothetical protein
VSVRPIQDAAGAADVDDPEPERALEPDAPESLVELDEPVVLDESEAFLDSDLGVAGDVADDLPRLSVR